MSAPAGYNQIQAFVAIARSALDGSLMPRISRGLMIAGLRNLHMQISTQEKLAVFASSADLVPLLQQISPRLEEEQTVQVMELILQAPTMDRVEWANRVVATGVLDSISGELSTQ